MEDISHTDILSLGEAPMDDARSVASDFPSVAPAAGPTVEEAIQAHPITQDAMAPPTVISPTLAQVPPAPVIPPVAVPAPVVAPALAATADAIELANMRQRVSQLEALLSRRSSQKRRHVELSVEASSDSDSDRSADSANPKKQDHFAELRASLCLLFAHIIVDASGIVAIIPATVNPNLF